MSQQGSLPNPQYAQWTPEQQQYYYQWYYAQQQQQPQQQQQTQQQRTPQQRPLVGDMNQRAAHMYDYDEAWVEQNVTRVIDRPARRQVPHSVGAELKGRAAHSMEYNFWHGKSLVSSGCMLKLLLIPR